MGEEAAGVDAVRIAVSRIGAGQSEIALVGGAHNGERPDLIMLYEFADMMLKDKFETVWARGPKGGFALGSIGAFLVIESRAHAGARGAKPLARISAVISDHAKRTPGAVTQSLNALWDKLKDRIEPKSAAAISGATGAEPATAEERAFLDAHGDLAVRATGSYLGHGLEPTFSMNIALATLALQHNGLFAPCDTSGFEKPMQAPLKQVLVTGVGHWRGEGLALVERAD
jgi:3-oxoacyl-[acyl-carrier-protein] synthase II